MAAAVAYHTTYDIAFHMLGQSATDVCLAFDFPSGPYDYSLPWPTIRTTYELTHEDAARLCQLALARQYVRLAAAFGVRTNGCDQTRRLLPPGLTPAMEIGRNRIVFDRELAKTIAAIDSSGYISRVGRLRWAPADDDAQMHPLDALNLGYVAVGHPRDWMLPARQLAIMLLRTAGPESVSTYLPWRRKVIADGCNAWLPQVEFELLRYSRKPKLTRRAGAFVVGSGGALADVSIRVRSAGIRSLSRLASGWTSGWKPGCTISTELRCPSERFNRLCEALLRADIERVAEAFGVTFTFVPTIDQQNVVEADQVAKTLWLTQDRFGELVDSILLAVVTDHRTRDRVAHI